MTEILTSNIQIEILMSDDKKERYILKRSGTLRNQ